MSTMTDRLSERFEGTGFSFGHPVAAAIEVDVADDSTVESVVITGADQPVMIVAAVEDSPLDTRDLQVSGLLGELLHRYEGKGAYRLVTYGPVPVDGSDAAEAAEIVYGEGDPRQALLVAARVDGSRIVTLQVHFPPSTAADNRPLALAVLRSLRIGSASAGILLR